MPVITKYYCDHCNADISDNPAKRAKMYVHCTYNVEWIFDKNFLFCTDCWCKFKKIILNENENKVEDVNDRQ